MYLLMSFDQDKLLLYDFALPIIHKFSINKISDIVLYGSMFCSVISGKDIIDMFCLIDSPFDMSVISGDQVNDMTTEGCLSILTLDQLNSIIDKDLIMDYLIENVDDPNENVACFDCGIVVIKDFIGDITLKVDKK